MSSFWEHFLPRWRYYQLVPYQVRSIVEGIRPHRARHRHYNVYNLHYLNPYRWDVPLHDLMRPGLLPPRYRYRHFTVPKKDGTRREIVEPGVDLKAMQQAILKHPLKRGRVHPSAVGYRKGMSIADHAGAHAGARTIITADIEDFFPSTTRYRVRQFWQDPRWNFTDDEVQLLTNLTTYLGCLPQGAPTSPALSNLVNYELDSRLHSLTTASGGVYTRYADDIVFSWRGRSRPPADFEATVRRILREYGYRLHPRKGWHVWARREEPEVTGVVLLRNGGVDVPRSMRRMMRALAKSDDPADAHRLEGYQAYRDMIQRGSFNS